ncbi:hypothetical protein KKI95_16705 [Xenorhabdus bovienii]|uniref:hypothetical protein n=1 Tax=Xenorhabdus bovienii TaxID=40576 RepID=UPI00237CF6D3|nr:hypothetical protein [Xenorhabdus bovienii]MDE1476206.1 hypothetical protein [Xenorhabdus bovienii]MDE1484115.1 hypothetical protein [Xenorhabdus bovienii]MDE9437527.1 hypothetical protein [Xenorhabdus bovienii]MDE9443378.1 hypothetical protein [Xenorhabdus bovienii]MDE9557001.1 hypothetical protein [Xenorhabdus bovienii]
MTTQKIITKKIVINVTSVIAIITILSICFIVFYKWDVKDGIANYADAYCEMDQDCLIDLSKVTPFNWDKAYIFQPGELYPYIDKAIGMKYNFIDVGLKFIFIKDNKIIYSEEYFPYPDLREFNQIHPNFSGNGKGNYFPDYYYITKENSKIFIKRHSSYSKKNNHYYLYPSNEYQSEKSNPYEK